MPFAINTTGFTPSQIGALTTAENAAPAGTTYANTNGKTTGTYTTPGTTSATKTANTSSPSGGPSTSPAVITSDAATQHLANVGTQLSTLHANAAAQNATVNGTAPTTPTSNASANNSPTPSGNAPASSANATPDTTSAPTDAYGSAIYSLLNQLQTGEDTINNNADASATTTDASGNAVPISTAIDENTAAEQQAQAQAAQSLLNITQGTYPLSSAEQQLMTSTVGSYTQLIQGQQTANNAFSGQIGEVMASLGIDTSAPSEATGMAYQAISTGNDKIATLNTKMAAAVSKLQQGFETEDYKAIQDQWNMLSKSFDDRTSALEKMQTDMETARQNQLTDIRNTVSTAITALTSVNTSDANQQKIAATAAQNLATNAYHQGMLNVSQYRASIAAATAANKTATAAQTKQQAQSALSAIFTGGSGATLDGAPTVDENGYVTPAAWKEALNTAIASGISRQDFVTEYGGSIYAPNGVADKSYGLSANDKNYLPTTVTTP